MREILFRGKRKDNGEWIEGYYCGKTCDTIFGPAKDSAQIIDMNLYWHDVIPETVGQYTGLTDNNGKKIFEGDILHCVFQWDMAKMVVVFEDGEFRMVLADQYKNYIKGSGFYVIRCFSKEIIGNIHDNPELLKGGEDK